MLYYKLEEDTTNTQVNALRPNSTVQKQVFVR